MISWADGMHADVVPAVLDAQDPYLPEIRCLRDPVSSRIGNSLDDTRRTVALCSSAREALLLRDRGDPPILDEGGAAIMIECRESEDAQGLEDRVDHRCDRVALAQYDRPARQGGDNDDRQSPEFLAHPQESPELAREGHCNMHGQLRTGSSLTSALDPADRGGSGSS